MATDYLDCATGPLLAGVNLVEASAGTGKTYAISMLVLRSIAEKNIPIERILVVTFTKAATEELKSRVRERLVQARDLLEKGDFVEADPTMARWLESVSDKSTVLTRLRLALYEIDRISIFTIHGFCQRMLQEHALESGQFFDAELQADIERIRQQVIADYWRQTIYPMGDHCCSIVVDAYPTPQKLLSSVTIAGQEPEIIEPATSSVDEVATIIHEGYELLAQWWKQGGAQLYPYFVMAQSEGKLKAPLKEELEQWWQSLERYFQGDETHFPDHLQFLTYTGLPGALNGNKIRGKAKQQEYIKDWPLPDHLVSGFADSARMLLLSLRREVLDRCRAKVDEWLQTRGYLSFNHLILSLDEQLQTNHSKLAQSLSARFEVALIDEFQDTDKIQWRIFKTLFDSPTHHLYLIGDPKQAIYKFRGADIYSYFDAKTVAAREYSLPTNYRSHPQLVEEVNRLFSLRTSPFCFSEDLMGFIPVSPAKTIEDGALYQGDTPLSPMVYCQLPANDEHKHGKWTMEMVDPYLRQYIVAEICRLLQDDEPVVIKKNADGMIESDQLSARDIAVLVRDNRQADEFAAAFAQANIPAVLVSRRSVFDTNEARELHTLLLALVTVGDMAKLKNCLAISWFGHSGNTLETLWQDEHQVELWISRFYGYHQQWRQEGFLPMMNSLLMVEEVYQTLASSTMAERSIANIHHLLELIQEEETKEKLGPEQTLSWLAKGLAGGVDGENRELRLESDEDAVRIMTMHSAKGLEYPVLFCPYLWYRSSGLAKEKSLVVCHDEELNLLLDLGSDQFDERKKAALMEEMAEEMRLLYVALTRAKYRCYVLWADRPAYMGIDSFKSSIGYLLFNEQAVDFKGQYQQFQKLAQDGAGEHRVLGADDLLLHQASANREFSQNNQDLVPLEGTGRKLQTEYQVSSYSALASLSEAEDHGVEPVEHQSERSEEKILHLNLPAGAGFGNLIHDSLEQLPFMMLGAGVEYETEIEKLCSRYGAEGQSHRILPFLQTIVSTPLLTELSEATQFTLAGIDDNRCLKEMEFYFHAPQLGAARINEILRNDPAVIALSHLEMQGYLTGFIDLICEFGGKYYLIDYKTNYLGDHPDDYTFNSLLDSMASHNYGLQYWIYTLVLHRHLKNIRSDYSYESHFGGVMYLFVRGMNPAVPGSGVYYTMPPRAELEALDQAVAKADSKEGHHAE